MRHVGRKAWTAGSALAAIVLAIAMPATAAFADSLGTITMFQIPENPGDFLTGLEGPIDIAPGPNATVWFADAEGNHLGEVQPSGAITLFPTNASQFSGSGDVSDGPDGDEWFTENNGEIGRITPNGAITYFTSGLDGYTPGDITYGPDGNLWLTLSRATGNAIGRMTPSGTISIFTSGLDGFDPARTGGFYQRGRIAAGADGNVWFSAADPSNHTYAIGRVTPSGAITIFTTGLASSSNPGALAAGPDGSVWFTEYGNAASSGDGYPVGPSGIGRITPSGVITNFNTGVPAGGDPEGITTGPDDSMWFVYPYLATLARITMSGIVTEGSIDDLVGVEFSIAVNSLGDLWTPNPGDVIDEIVPNGPPASLAEGPLVPLFAVFALVLLGGALIVGNRRSVNRLTSPETLTSGD